MASITIDAKSTFTTNISGFSGKGETIACIVNTEFDLVQCTGHMTDTSNTIMRVSLYNDHTASQTISISAIRLYYPN